MKFGIYNYIQEICTQITFYENRFSENVWGDGLLFIYQSFSHHLLQVRPIDRFSRATAKKLHNYAGVFLFRIKITKI